MNRTIRFFMWLEDNHSRLFSLWISYIHKNHKIEIEDMALGKVSVSRDCSQVNAWRYRCMVCCGDVFMSIPDKDVINEIDSGNKTYSESFVWQQE